MYFVVSAWVPHGHTLLYPLTLFTTWVHEMGHGLTALIMGGEFDSLVINGNAGGFARAYASHGWPEALVAAGGLLAPPLLGGLILATVHGGRRARFLLGFLAIGIVVSLLVYVRSPAGWIALPIVAAGLGWAAYGFRDAPHRRVLVAQLLAVILSADTLTRMVRYAFMGKLDTGETSDVGLIEDNLGGNYKLWGFMIVVIAVVALAGGLWVAIRRTGHKSGGKPAGGAVP